MPSTMIEVLLRLLFAFSCVGVVSSTVFLGLAFAGARKALVQRRSAARDGITPPVSLLKPLHGMEPQLERNLESFFEQEYAGDFELLFCASSEADEALKLARKVATRYPQVTARFLVSGESPWTNAKVWSLEQMGREASYDIFVVSDSDVEVGRKYLDRVIAPFAAEMVGCVTCLYRGKSTGGVWSNLEGLAMSVEMTSGVVTANLLEGMKFALGPTMAMRRAAIEQFGGFEALAEYCSDDFLIGNWIAERGWQVVLSDYVIDHVILHRSLLDSLRHQARWMRSTRFSRPAGHLGTGLTFAMPFGILAALSASGMGHLRLGMALLFWCYATRVLQSVLIGWFMVRDKMAVRWAWAYPVRELMGFGFWVASYCSGEIQWRGKTYRLLRGGQMIPCN